MAIQNWVVKKIDLYSEFANRWLDDFHTSSISWNILSPTVHMLFVHGSDIFRESPVAPGYLSGQFNYISLLCSVHFVTDYF